MISTPLSNAELLGSLDSIADCRQLGGQFETPCACLRLMACRGGRRAGGVFNDYARVGDRELGAFLRYGGYRAAILADVSGGDRCLAAYLPRRAFGIFLQNLDFGNCAAAFRREIFLDRTITAKMHGDYHVVSDESNLIGSAVSSAKSVTRSALVKRFAQASVHRANRKN
jgi:hypothetical protein